ncbi:bifunctional diguanylate cyclase/phosphodiesterase [Jeotgalibacillus salarius]|uniref:EAL domain-containing protein n=1 Tax=Jeotgalibacillus salarius TaxID=546023 RepID=A0A4Y8LCA9_9BACL|nr:EAL domain-containing protein [Jeotgalibacillus salarius]TFD99800.1 EAL domain-containing protein [Jeotgalibacillus salarius]
MRIRNLAILVLGSFLVLAIMFIQFLMTPLQLEEANEFDQERVERDVERVRNYLIKEQEDLLYQAIDWSAWDETHFYVNGKNSDYVSDNLQPEMIANLQVQLMIFVNEQGEFIHTAGVNRDGTTFNLDQNFLEKISEIEFDNEVFYESHLGEMMMVASHPITRNDFSDPSGYLMMGRVIDGTYLTELSETLSVDIALSSAERTIALEQSDKISGEYIIENLDRSSVLPLSIGADREFYVEKQNNLKKFKTMAAVGFLLIALAVYFLFRQMVLGPIISLASGLRRDDGNLKIGSDRGLFKRLYEVRQLENEFSDMIRDIRQANEEITVMAYHDQLTGLGNRFYLQKNFGSFVKETAQKKAVMFFDLDGFKKVNDTWGHEVGDLLLQEMTARLKGYFDYEDVMLARIGGDEFVAVVSYHQEDYLLTRGEELKNLICQEFRLGSVSAYISASIGISLYPEEGEDLSSLLKKADAAMYEAKADGKNKVLLYKKLVETGKYIQSERLKEDTKSALENGELSLAFQPVFEASGSQMVGTEALLRWHHPEIGHVSPELFIGMMEESGTIHEVGKWVLSEGLKQLSKWHALGHRQLSMSVNFSKKQLFHKEDFLKHLDKELKKNRVPVKNFVIEITESEVSYYDNDLMLFIKDLQQRGVRVALDDFGKGTASLHGLRKLPVDIVKIDRSFMESIPHENFNASLLIGIYSLLKQLGIEVVTEGVENKEQLAFISRESNSSMQGYYFSKPLHARLITEHLTGHSEIAFTKPFDNVYPLPKGD